MGKLRCDRCGVVYNEKADIELAKNTEQEWEEMCKQDGVIPKGIAPCPNMMCEGELILTI